ncbi:unnamed protein product [Pedinophyceae sp. YPF-701]|nr:unnamed protein product [Pedinophyceae sp. YPF-701]
MGGVRFAPGPFAYNARVGLALLPPLMILANCGGQLVLGTLLVGTLCAYILDATGVKEGALASLWGTMILSNLELILTGALSEGHRPTLLTLLLTLASTCLLLLTGVWATLQFRWIQVTSPAAAVSLERLLLTAAGPVAAVLLAWWLSVAVGPSLAPFYLLPALPALYFMLGRALVSSFHRPAGPESKAGHAPPASALAVGPTEALVAFLVYTLLPAAHYLGTHAFDLLHWEALWSLMLLVSVPPLVMLSGHRGVWWAEELLSARDARIIQHAGQALAGTVALAGAQGRIIMPSFGQYIKAPPPWNHVEVSVALFGGALAAAGVLSGWVRRRLPAGTSSVMVLLAAAAVSVAVGLPMWLTPAPIVAAGCLASVLEDFDPSIYAAFVVLSTATGGWLMRHHFGFLDVRVAGVPLSHVNAGALLLFLPALALPGMVYCRAPRSAVAAAMLAQAAGELLLEEHLFTSGHGEEHLYPPWLVVATSVAGAAGTYAAESSGRLPAVAAWALHCAYLSKSAMVLLPEVSVAKEALALALAVSPPVALYGASTRQLDGARPLSRDREGLQRASLGAGAAWLHVLGMVVALAYARFSFFDVLRRLVGAAPSQATVLGVMALGLALGCALLVGRFFPFSTSARLGVTLVGVIGALLVLLRPPLPVHGGAKCPHLPFGLCPRLWDASHVPDNQIDDYAIYGPAMGVRRHWPLWLLILAAVLMLGALGGGRQAGQRQAARAAIRGGAGIAAGALVGGYVALELTPGMPAIQLLIFASTMATALFVCILELPVAVAGLAPVASLPWLIAVWAACLPLALLATYEGGADPGGAAAEAAGATARDAWAVVSEERRETSRAAIVAAAASQALILALAMKLRVSRALGPGGASDGPARGQAGARGAAGKPSAFTAGSMGALQRVAGFLGSSCAPGRSAAAPVDRMAGMSGGGGAWMKLAAEGLGWLPTAGNAATLLCFVTGAVLSRWFMDRASLSVLSLAPVLLLLNQDAYLLPNLTQARRYAPLAAAVSSALVAISLVEAVSSAPVDTGSDVLTVARSSQSSFFPLLAVGLAVPSHLMLVTYLWTRRWVPAYRVALVTPLNIASLLMTGGDSGQVLGALGLAGGVAQFFMMYSSKVQGLRMV